MAGKDGLRLRKRTFALQHVGELAAFNAGQHVTAQGTFAVALLGQMQQSHHVMTGLIGIQGLTDVLPDTPVIVAGQQVIPPLGMAEGARLFDQGFDHMVVIDAAPSFLPLGVDPGQCQRMHAGTP
jgi:hypothetical protein